MSENSNHIVSRFRWNTAFDQKERASELQQRLSALSGISMQREMADVFDKICPPDQTWRIQSLEIDLGEIELDNLEAELLEKLRRQLSEKLIDMIIYMNRSGNPNIEILNRDASETCMLRSFLLHGVMPWNYKRGDGSVNQMLEAQLQNSREVTIEMIKEVGAGHETVRKRMAWQFNELNLYEIVKGLEPANHTQITDFSNELVNIQSKETIVQANSTEFRKNVWLWVLNYLLTERGTLFNSVAFMRSSIRQMAGHYNISYDDLFEMIEQAVDRLSRTYTIKAGFIITLKSLSKDKSNIENRKVGTEDQNLDAYHITILTQEDKNFSTYRFKELLIVLCSQVVSNKIEKEQFNALKKSFIKLIRLNPKAALQEMIEYPGKDGLQTLLPYVLTQDVGRTLVAQVEKDTASIVSIFLQFAQELRGAKEFTSLVHWMDGHIAGIILETIVLYPGASQLRLLELILEEIDSQLPASENEQFALMLDQFIHFEKVRPLEIAESIVSCIKKIGSALTKYVSLEHISTLIKTSHNRQSIIKKLIPAGFNSRKLTQSEAHKKKEGIEILNYLLPGGTQLMGVLIREYAGFLKQELNPIPEKEINVRLTELYWQCILQYSAHNGNREAFKRMFKAAVLFSFPVADTVAHIHSGNGLYPAKGNRRRLKDGRSISQEKLFFLIRQCFTANIQSISENGAAFHAAELLCIALETNPKALRSILADVNATTEKNISLLQASVPFSRFSAWIMSDTYGELNKAMEATRSVHSMLTHLNDGEPSGDLMNIIWKKTFRLIATSKWSQADLNELVRDTLYELARGTTIHAHTIIAQLKRKSFRMSPILKKALTECMPAFSTAAADELIKTPDDRLMICEQKGLLNDLCYHLIVQKQIPSWLAGGNEQEVKSLLNDIIIHHPIKFLTILRREIISEPQMVWLSRSINFTQLIISIGELNKNRQGILAILDSFHASLANISISGIAGRDIQHLLFKKLIKAWASDQWTIVSTENIWNELIHAICISKGISRNNFLQEAEQVKHFFPPALQVSIGKAKEQTYISGMHPVQQAIAKRKISPMKNNDPSPAKGGIPVMNAGLVLLNSYVPILFERLGIMSNKKFNDDDHALQAVHYLQLVVTGLCFTEESYLPLNKVLCGLPVSQPVPDGIDISPEHKELIEGLIKATIGHWPSIGNCSVEGFRGNWLVRGGLLIEHEDKWELSVEKRAYDLLIHRSPFSFSIIKYPWMNKPLHVNWPY